MKPQTSRLLDKAARAIRAAREMLVSSDADFAVSRAYCAIFYAAQALLNERDLRYRKDSGVHAAFGRHFAHVGFLRAARHYLEAQE